MWVTGYWLPGTGHGIKAARVCVGCSAELVLCFDQDSKQSGIANAREDDTCHKTCGHGAQIHRYAAQTRVELKAAQCLEQEVENGVLEDVAEAKRAAMRELKDLRSQ